MGNISIIAELVLGNFIQVCRTHTTTTRITWWRALFGLAPTRVCRSCDSPHSGLGCGYLAVAKRHFWRDASPDQVKIAYDDGYLNNADIEALHENLPRPDLPAFVLDATDWVLFDAAFRVPPPPLFPAPSRRPSWPLSAANTPTTEPVRVETPTICLATTGGQR